MARRILWFSLVLAPVVIALAYGGAGDVLVFVVAAAALIPLAWLIGEATEHAAHHTGPGVGGFLNATFGNAPELIIALFAVSNGLPEVVRGSLTGSVIGNLLLVLGFSLLFGGRGELDRFSSLLSLGLVFGAALLFLIPAIPSWEGDPERHSLAVASLPVSIALLVVYVGVTWYSLRRHRELFHTSDEADTSPQIGTYLQTVSASLVKCTHTTLSFRIESGKGPLGLSDSGIIDMTNELMRSRPGFLSSFAHDDM